MTRLFCDRCEKEITADDISVGYFRVELRLQNFAGACDLCADCRAELKKTLTANKFDKLLGASFVPAAPAPVVVTDPGPVADPAAPVDPVAQP